MNIHPSFKAVHGREPIPNQDFNPDDLQRDDYEYLVGCGQYHDYRLGINLVVDESTIEKPTIHYSLEVLETRVDQWVTVRLFYNLLRVERYLKPLGMSINTIPLDIRKISVYIWEK